MESGPKPRTQPSIGSSIESAKDIFDERRLASSLRLRFAAYAVCLLCVLVTCALALLTATGAVNPTQRNVDQMLEHQLESSLDLLTRNVDDAAANGMALSRQLSYLVESYLSRNGIDFSDLNDNQAALEALQADAFGLLSISMQATPCSGAFFLLNATVNSSLETLSSSGLYLKYVNLNAESTAHNRLCLYRGAYSVARSNDIILHSSWQLETARGTFPALDQAMGTQDETAPAYFLTETYDLPDTWESARFLCLPVTGANGEVLGVCGYEVNDLYFQLAYQTLEGSDGQMICMLLDEPAQSTRGCLAGSHSGYFPSSGNSFSLSEDDVPSSIQSSTLSSVQNEGVTYVGKTASLPESNSSHTVVVALTESRYESLMGEGRTKAILSLLSTLAVALALSWWLGKRYLKPVAERLEYVRSRIEAERALAIAELATAEAERDTAAAERDIAEAEQARAQSKLDMLADKKKLTVDPRDYQAFREGLPTLTPKERSILGLIAQGYGTEEVMELAGIGRNTLKYHNRNIYAKLGVSSRKQLLLYLQIMQREPESGEANLF